MYPQGAGSKILKISKMSLGTSINDSSQSRQFSKDSAASGGTYGSGSTSNINNLVDAETFEGSKIPLSWAEFNCLWF